MPAGIDKEKRHRPRQLHGICCDILKKQFPYNYPVPYFFPGNRKFFWDAGKSSFINIPSYRVKVSVAVIWWNKDKTTKKQQH